MRQLKPTFPLLAFALACLAQAQSEGPMASTGNAKPGSLSAILSAEAYLTPPQAVADFLNAPRHKNHTLSNLSPDGKLFLIVESAGMTPLSDLGRPWHNLAGVQVDPAANRARSLTTSQAVGLTLYDWAADRKLAVELPKGARVASAVWSPDGSKLAFLVSTETASHLAVADCATGKSRILSRTPLLATQVTRPEWSGDGKHLFAVFVPEKRIELKSEPVASQPVVRVSEPTKNQTRTYRSLLENATSQALFEHYLTGQLAKVEAASGRMEKIGEPRMYRSMDPAPSGMHVRVTVIQKPFSYIVPASSFGSLEEIVDLAGKQLVEVQKRNLRVGSTPDPDPGYDYVPPEYDWSEELRAELQGRRGGAGAGAGAGSQSNTGRRSLSWAPDGNGLIFLQLEPAAPRGEEAAAPSARRKDRVMRWAPPFGKDDQTALYTTEGSISSAQFGSDGKTLFVTETASGTTTTYAVSLAEPTKKVAILTRRGGAEESSGPSRGGAGGSDAFYDNPGSWVTRANALGVSTVRVSAKGEAFLSGTQYSKDYDKEAPRPFLDAVNLADGTKRRVWQSPADAYETIAAHLDDEGNRFVVTRQSPTRIADSYLVTAGNAQAKQLTRNVDYSPMVTMAQRHRVQVTRADGIKFWVEVTLPAGHARGNRLPALFWFYPREYTDQASYDRTLRTRNINQFPNVGTTSKDLLVLFGYAVVEPDCPIIGPSGRMNDNYVHDLRSNLYATINELEKQGWIDRDRLALGGHSYGAFSTANAMVHTPFFKAGIAGDGAYNRMLTPMAFQSEQRILWDARETYLNMSPLLYAEKLTGALLLYHGAEDQNVGTHPINSERMFHALDGLGKDVAMYMYPYEDHGPAAKETIQDLWARWIAWLDKYLKGEEK
jgi:dipeptidyl aminopeptidase/acylaminoacyl peptidase